LTSVEIFAKDLQQIMPRFYSQNATLFIFDTWVHSVFPSAGPWSGLTVTVRGNGFENAANQYTCHFDGEHHVAVHAVFVTSMIMTCETGEWATNFPSGDTVLYVVRNDLATSLGINIDSASISFNLTGAATVTTLSGTDLPRILVGSYLKIGSEYMLVTESFLIAGDWYIVVNRGQRGSAGIAHNVGALVQVLVSHESGSQGLRFNFLSSFQEINPEIALVSHEGGPIMEIRGHGLNASFLPAYYILPSNYSSSKVHDVTRESPSPRGFYFGHMFEVVAKSIAIRLMNIEIASNVQGEHQIWIYTRICPESLSCGFVGAETNLQKWALNTHMRVNVTNTNATVQFNTTNLLVLPAGQRLGLAIFSDKGIRLTTDPSYAPSDFFCSVNSGILVEGQPADDGYGFSSFYLPSTVAANSSFMFPGRIQYLTEPINGDIYRCQFRSVFQDRVALSRPTKAFAASAGSLRQATRLFCIIPEWSYGEANTTFSVLSEAGLELKKDTSSGVQYFGMSASWHAMIGPTEGMGEGGTLLTISGTGFNDDGDITYECTFRAADGFQASSEMIVQNTSRGFCRTPGWRWKYTTTKSILCAEVELLLAPLFLGQSQQARSNTQLERRMD